MPLNDIRIIARIGVVVGAIFLMMLLLMFVEMKTLSRIKNNLEEIVSVNNEKLILAQDMRFLARNSAVLLRNVLLVGDAGTKASELARLAEDERLYRAAEEKLESLEADPRGLEILASLGREERRTRELWQQVVDLEGAGEPEKALALLTDSVRTPQRGWLDRLAGLVNFQKDAAVAAARQARQVYDRTMFIVLVGDGVILLVSVFLVLFLASGIVRPLREFARSVDSIASGDLTTRIPLDRQDEIGTLGARINNMAEQLQATEKELDQYRFHLEELIEERTGALNEQRKKFTSVLIHDLKGPLVPIIGFSQKLYSGSQIPRDKVVEYARAIYHASMKLAATIDHVSTELRGNRLQHCYDSEIFDIRQLLESVAASYAPKAELDHIELSMRCSGGDDRILFSGDSAKLQSLFENLIGNAVKYARSRVGVELAREGGRLVLTIEDDGCGIEQEYHEKIFDEYFQAPNSKEGSGVGLYSVRKIVEHYHGAIHVGESPDGGARFTVELPTVIS
ncbi:MAG: HAMP domain-containing protein [Desulfobulbaceae bacterium]|nr:MAG: HAMP domain-containing protein [Desulfobulbaceae bacterium]